MAAKKNKEKSKSEKSKSSYVHVLGKYFLISFVVFGQVFTAYVIVDKNYEEIYRFVNGVYLRESGTYHLKKIVTNIAGTNSNRYLLVELSLKLARKDDTALIERNKSQIRHSLIEYLSSQTVDQLRGINQKEELRVNLIKVINNAIGFRSVRNLYYTRYVMQ